MEIYYYWLIEFVLFFIINILNLYFNSFKIIKPILLLTINFVIKIFKINNKCKFEKLPLIEIFNRSLILLSVYLYSEYTITCIPMIKLIMGKLFELPKTSFIIKFFIAFIFMRLGDYILHLYNKENEEDDICNIENESPNIIVSLCILGVIIINTYLNFIKI